LLAPTLDALGKLGPLPAQPAYITTHLDRAYYYYY